MRHAYGYANGDTYADANADSHGDGNGDAYTDANTDSHGYGNTDGNSHSAAETKPDTKAASDTAATSLALVENLKAGTRERKLASSPPAVAGDYSGSPACHADARR